MWWLPRSSAGSRGCAIVMVRPAEHRSADNACGLSAPFEFEQTLHQISLPNSRKRRRDVEVVEGGPRTRRQLSLSTARLDSMLEDARPTTL